MWLVTVVYYFLYGETITNCWNLFCYGVKRHHFNKSISIREFSEQLLLISSIILSQQTQACRKRTYLPLMTLASKALCQQFWSLKYPSSYLHNSEISTISDITIVTSLATAIDHMDLKDVQFRGGRYNRAARGY